MTEELTIKARILLHSVYVFPVLFPVIVMLFSNIKLFQNIYLEIFITISIFIFVYQIVVAVIFKENEWVTDRMIYLFDTEFNTVIISFIYLFVVMLTFGQFLESPWFLTYGFVLVWYYLRLFSGWIAFCRNKPIEEYFGMPLCKRKER